MCMGNNIEIAEKCVQSDEYIVFSDFHVVGRTPNAFAFSFCCRGFGDVGRETDNELQRLVILF